MWCLSGVYNICGDERLQVKGKQLQTATTTASGGVLVIPQPCVAADHVALLFYPLIEPPLSCGPADDATRTCFPGALALMTVILTVVIARIPSS